MAWHTDHRTTTFILVRHGQSEWNRMGRFQGQQDSSLTDLGRAQAWRVVRRLQGMSVAALYSSDLRRAWETAEIIGQALGLAPIPDVRLREIDVGLWSGLTREEIVARFPDEWQAWREGIDVPRGGGESFSELQQRVVAALHDMLAAHSGRTVVVVSHGGPIRALLAYALGLDFAEAQGRIFSANAAISVIQREDGRFRVVRMGDISHLEGIEEAPKRTAGGERET